MERETHIRAKYLGALEDDRFEVLPGQAYVRGFLRTYADFLGLQSDLYIEEFNEKFAPPEEEAPAIQHRPERRRELRLVRPIAGSLLALAAATVVVWQLGFASAQRTAAPTDEHITPPRTTTAQDTTPTKPRHSATPGQVAPATVTGPATLVVRASRGDCWVAVRIGSATGQVVYESTLAQGGTLRFGLKQQLWVRLGAPWNTDVTLRGKPVGTPAHTPMDMTAA